MTDLVPHPGTEPGTAPPDPVEAAVADAHRHEWAFVLAATARVAGDLDLAQECVQDAYVKALATWGRDGVPRSPAAWLTTAARNRALDVLRREKTLRTKLPLLVPDDDEVADDGVAGQTGGEPTSAIPDDRLRLVFTCCHPTLGREAQVALTLRLVCGLSTEEVARAFLVPVPTMAARVTRAKKKIAGARIPYRVPAASELPERLDAVLTVVHLLFTTGHTAPSGDVLVRADLTERAIDLARMLWQLLPDEREVRGLLSLMLLTDARRPTRTDERGHLLLLEDQDRSLWNSAQIAEATPLVLSALRGPRAGRFALQAAIAAVHAEAVTYADTDWLQIVGLYDALYAVWPSPVIRLNQAVALAMAHGPEVGLAEVQALQDEPRLQQYRYLWSTKADLLRRLGRDAEAATAYTRALELSENTAEREFLSGRLSEVLSVGEP